MFFFKKKFILKVKFRYEAQRRVQVKILMTTDLYTPVINGVVTSIRTLKQSLEEKGHDVRILTLSENPEINHTDHIYFASSFNFNKVYPGARFSLSVNQLIYQKIIEWQPDIIHSHCEFSTFKMAKDIAQELDIPIIHTYHTIYEDYTHYFSPNKKIGEKIVSFFSRRILNQTELVITPTEKVKQLLNKYQVDTPIEIIPTGINTAQFDQPLNEKEVTHLKRSLDICEEDRVLLFIGRIAKEKNIEELINYLSKMHTPNIKLLICGDGPFRKNLEKYIETRHLTNQVIFTGMICPDNIATYYQLGDIFVNASTSETQGLTYIEALLSGLPVLCRNDESIENVIFNGVNGFMFDDYEEFETYLNVLLKHPEKRASMGQVAQLIAKQVYSDKAFANKIEAQYNNVLNTHQRHLGKTKSGHSIIHYLKSWV